MSRLQGKTPQQLHASLKSGVGPAYYLTGEDGWGKDRAREAIVKVLAPDPSCLHRLRGGEVDGPELVGLAASLGLFSERRLVWIDDAGRIAAAAKKPIADYLASPNPSTCLVFTTDDWKADAADPIVAGVAAAGGHYHFRPPTGETLLAWAFEAAKRKGVELTRAAAERLVGEAGSDRSILSQEIERLALYKEKGTIEEADVAACLGYEEQETVYRLALAVQAAAVERTQAARRQALDLLSELYASGEEPVKLCNWVGYAVQHLLAGKRMMEDGAPESGLKFKVRAFYNDDLGRMARRASEERLVRSLGHVLESEVRLKSGVSKEQALLELKDLVLRASA